jgi:hypothetical protein
MKKYIAKDSEQFLQVNEELSKTNQISIVSFSVYQIRNLNMFKLISMVLMSEYINHR